MYSKMNGGKNILVGITCGLLLAMEIGIGIDIGIGKGKKEINGNLIWEIKEKSNQGHGVSIPRWMEGENITLGVTCGLLLDMEIDIGIGKGKRQ